MASSAKGADWITLTYCAHNPTRKVDDAVQALVVVLWPTRQVMPPVTVVPPAPLSAPRSVPVKRSLRSPQF